jgi:CheY-like chemotaxis protein
MDVLIVDDETEIVRLLVDILSEEGYRVGVARDGASAIAHVLHDSPSLVLLDYSMPGMTGGEVVRQIRARGMVDVPIVIMSAGTRAEALNVPGATAFLPKPFDLDKLLACVAHYVTT